MADLTGTDGLEVEILRDLQRDFKSEIKFRLTMLDKYDGFDEPKAALMTPSISGKRWTFYLEDESIWCYRGLRSIGREKIRAVPLARPDYKKLFIDFAVKKMMTDVRDALKFTIARAMNSAEIEDRVKHHNIAENLETLEVNLRQVLIRRGIL